MGLKQLVWSCCRTWNSCLFRQVVHFLFHLCTYVHYVFVRKTLHIPVQENDISFSHLWKTIFSSWNQQDFLKKMQYHLSPVQTCQVFFCWISIHFHPMDAKTSLKFSLLFTNTGLTRMVFTLLQTNVIFQLMGHSGVGAYACHQHSGSPWVC